MAYEQFGMSPGRSALLRLAPLLLAFIPAIATMARGCQEGPFGRRQIVGMSVPEEMQLGAQAFNQVLDQNRTKIVASDDPVALRVREIGGHLMKAAVDPAFLEAAKIPHAPNFQWDFKVIRDGQLNAFCLPGGKVVVYTGIVPVCHNDAGLATVMGHEIGHAIAHHGAERMAQQKLVQMGELAVANSFGGMDGPSQQRMMTILNAGANMGILLPFSRKHESEADKLGLYLMAAAGYDPSEASEFWKRMQSMSKGGGSPEFMSTHPGHERRAQDLRVWSKDVAPLYQKSSRQAGDRKLP